MYLHGDWVATTIKQDKSRPTRRTNRHAATVGRVEGGVGSGVRPARAARIRSANAAGVSPRTNPRWPARIHLPDFSLRAGMGVVLLSAIPRTNFARPGTAPRSLVCRGACGRAQVQTLSGCSRGLDERSPQLDAIEAIAPIVVTETRGRLPVIIPTARAPPNDEKCATIAGRGALHQTIIEFDNLFHQLDNPIGGYHSIVNQIRVGSRIAYQVNAPTTFLLNISVVRNEYQRVISESLRVDPFHKIEECAVCPLGNRLVRLSVPAGDLQISYQAVVELNVDQVEAIDVGETPYERLPAHVLTYLNPSRYCESDEVLDLAVQQFGNLLPGYSRVTAICNWTYNEISYTPGSTGATTTAIDVLQRKQGVCRDFAHVAITLCRALGVPARYVTGYAVNLHPPDFHGFFEAYLDDRWFLFDATRLAPVGGFVRIGTGRDAADVAFSTIRGSAIGTDMQVWAYESQPDDELLDPANVQTAVSSA